jgi:hypothetical protein
MGRLLQKRIGAAVLALALAALLPGCGGKAAPADAASSRDAALDAGGPSAAESVLQAGSASAADSEPSAPPASAASASAAAGYAMPAFAGSAFHADAAAGENGVLLDLSAAAQGYVAVSAQNDRRLKFRVLFGDTTYTYDLPSDGTPAVYPLQSGSGSYTFQVFRNISGTQYAKLYTASAQVTLESEFAPFLRPSQLVNYAADSDCVALTAKLAQGCADDAELVSAVYAYLCAHVAYDYDKAETVKSGYLPVPDETLSTGKGICFDYAALSAAMLRSAGIPTRLITGYVGETYHAWNAVYLEGQGWITVEIKASTKVWQRIDTTFAATGADTEFLTNDANYVTRFTY